MFWGWLKSLLQYAFYQVIAQAFVFVFGSFLINFLDAFPPPYTVDRLLVGGFHLIFLLFAFTYGLLKVPSLTHLARFPAARASPPCRASWGNRR